MLTGLMVSISPVSTLVRLLVTAEGALPPFVLLEPAGHSSHSGCKCFGFKVESFVEFSLSGFGEHGLNICRCLMRFWEFMLFQFHFIYIDWFQYCGVGVGF